MTLDELDKLPINSISPDYEVVTLPDSRYPGREGDTLRIPIIKKGRIMHVDKDDYAMIEDSKGRFWSTGTIDGVKHKQRAPF